MSAKPITVAIVEDHPGLRRGLETIVNRDSGLKCIGSFPDGEQALRDLPDLRPRVILMDINLPKMDGIECVTNLAQALPDTQVIMLTAYDDTEAIFRSLAAGAGGYLLKPVRAAQLVVAINEVVAGGAPMSSNIARRVVQAFRKTGAATDEMETLAAREREILNLLANGLLQKEIADQLAISYWTVQTHIGRIYQKLHVHSRAQAVAKYLRKQA